MSNLRVLIEGTLGVSVDGARGGEDSSSVRHKMDTQSLAVVLSHAFQKVDGADQVVLVVLQTLALRLSHMLERRKVNDGIKRSVLLKHGVGAHGIQERTLDETDTDMFHIHKPELILLWLRNPLDCL